MKKWMLRSKAVSLRKKVLPVCCTSEKTFPGLNLIGFTVFQGHKTSCRRPYLLTKISRFWYLPSPLFQLSLIFNNTRLFPRSTDRHDNRSRELNSLGLISSPSLYLPILVFYTDQWTILKMLDFPAGTKTEPKCHVTHGTMGHLDPKQPPTKRKPFAAILNHGFVQKVCCSWYVWLAITDEVW